MSRGLRILIASMALFAIMNWPANRLLADTTPQTLPFTQNWSNTGLITAPDDWSGVPGIVGYRGDALASGTGVDPRTIVTASTVVDVNANQTNPNTYTTGGVTEFQLADPVVAIQGSGTARAPYLSIYLNTAGNSNIRVQLNLRDIDGSKDNAVQPIAIQYRVGSTTNFSNVYYLADASSGPEAATMVTPVDITLPADADNQSLVEVRIITADAVGSDEWIGIDDINVTGQPMGLKLTPISAPAGVFGAPYSQVITAENTGGQACTFGSTGTLPPGLGLTNATDSTVTLAGIPTAVGSYTFSITATCGSAGSTSNSYTQGVTGVTLTLSPATLPNGLQSSAYSQAITTTGGEGACTFSLASGTLPSGVTLSSSGILSGTPVSSGTFNITVGLTCNNGTGSQAYAWVVDAKPFNCGDTRTFIHNVQGSGATSPLVGQIVDVEGIVVGSFPGTTGFGGFFLQEADADADADPATSEGVFVYTSSATVSRGDRVRVRGTVAEYASGNSFVTEIGSVTNAAVCSSGQPLPTPAAISLPMASSTGFEQYEGMLVSLAPPSAAQPFVVVSNYELGRYGSFDVAPSLLMYATQTVLPGAAAQALDDVNSRSFITIDDGSNSSGTNLYPTIYPAGGLSASNTLRLGDWVNWDALNAVSKPIIGVLDDRFDKYRIHPTEALTFTAKNLRQAAPSPVGGRFKVASANVLNFFTTLGSAGACGPTGKVSCRGADNATEYDRQIPKMVAALIGTGADILLLSEVENNADGTFAITALVNALNATAGAGAYNFIATGAVGTDSIKNAIVYKTARVEPVGSPATFSLDDQNRPSIAQTFRPVAALGLKPELSQFTVVVNHFRSRGSGCSTDPTPAYGQENCSFMRLRMAQGVINWLAGNPTTDTSATRRLILMGDLNCYAMEDPIRAMTDTTFSLTGYPASVNATYKNLVNLFIGPGAYSYNYSSQSGYIDHALANPAMERLVTGVTEWHTNAAEPIALDYNLDYKSAAAQTAYYATDAFRAADHDPLIVGFNPLAGDFNNDGKIDAADQAIIRGAIGKPLNTVDRRLDLDGDGAITLADYQAWARLYVAFR